MIESVGKLLKVDRGGYRRTAETWCIVVEGLSLAWVEEKVGKEAGADQRIWVQTCLAQDLMVGTTQRWVCVLLENDIGTVKDTGKASLAHVRVNIREDGRPTQS